MQSGSFDGFPGSLPLVQSNNFPFRGIVVKFSRGEYRRRVLMGRGAGGCSRWNVSIFSWAFFKFFSGSQVCSSLGNPFQCTRYSKDPRRNRESLISSTSYSTSSLIITGGEAAV